MKIMNSVALAGVLALGLVTGAQAQTIPSPSNPTPFDPIATNGTPLPQRSGEGYGLFTGRSAFAPVGNLVGTSLDAAGAVVGTGLGTAGAIVR